jgi:hypothetical protein
MLGVEDLSGFQKRWPQIGVGEVACGRLAFQQEIGGDGAALTENHEDRFHA